MIHVLLVARMLHRILIAIPQAFLMFGYDAGVLSGVQDTKPYLDAIGNPQLHSTIIIPMIASSYTLGTCVMSIGLTFVALPLGRRRSILLGNLLVIVGAAIQASSFSVPQIIVGRLLCVSALLLYI